MTPIAALHAAVDRDGLDPSWHRVLEAFGGPDGDPRDLPARIRAALADEVDPDQAALFARRYVQLIALLARVPGPEAPLLTAFLVHRAAGILDAPPPRALRIRALVDYVFAHASVVVHRDPTAPTVAERVRATAASAAFDGARRIAHATVAGPTRDGPVHLNLVRLAPGVRFDAHDVRPRHGGDLAAIARADRAPVAFSGGFFLYSEPEILGPSVRGDPVGLLVSGGTVVGAPAFRRSAVVRWVDGRVGIARIGPEDAHWTLGPRPLRPTATNDPQAPAPAAYNRAYGLRSPDRPERGVAVVAGRVVAIDRGPVPIPLAGVVLVVPDDAILPPVGAAVEVRLPGIAAAMGGGPRLLGPWPLGLGSLPDEDFAGTAPPVTFSQDETFDTNRLPRLAVGTDPDGATWVVAVDGRDLDRAPGLTLAGTADVLAAVGCTEAVNLDGGSSKRMVVDGRVVDLPSTEVGPASPDGPVRPVRSAILVEGSGWGPPTKGR